MTVWTEAKTEKLRSLHATGFSCAMIAGRLNEEFGYPLVTRNAVIGKVTRLGLTGSGPKPGQNATVRVKKKAAPADAKEAAGRSRAGRTEDRRFAIRQAVERHRRSVSRSQAAAMLVADRRSNGLRQSVPGRSSLRMVPISLIDRAGEAAQAETARRTASHQ